MLAHSSKLFRVDNCSRSIKRQSWTNRKQFRQIKYNHNLMCKVLCLHPWRYLKVQWAHVWESQIQTEISSQEWCSTKFADLQGIHRQMRASLVLSKRLKMKRLVALRNLVLYRRQQSSLKVLWTGMYQNNKDYHHIHIALRMQEWKSVVVNWTCNEATTATTFSDEIAPPLDNVQIVHFHNMLTNHSSLLVKFSSPQIWFGTLVKHPLKETVLSVAMQQILTKVLWETTTKTEYR